MPQGTDLMPALPDIYALTAMLLAAAALVLFTRQSIPLQSSALLLLIIMALASLWLPLDADAIRLSPADLYAGFGNQALVAIVCLMLCAKGLEHTGALHDLAQVLGRSWRHSPRVAQDERAARAAAREDALHRHRIRPVEPRRRRELGEDLPQAQLERRAGICPDHPVAHMNEPAAPVLLHHPVPRETTAWVDP